MTDSTLPLLTIVIPALNEDAAIGAIIERSIAARETICKSGNIRDIEVIVVSDGSTDRTVEIASNYAEKDDRVSLIEFKTNRGYGAAIKEAFACGHGELVGILDADGTCDPTFFGSLCYEIQHQSAIIALGSRMEKGSQMPTIRRLGNRLFALLLGFLSGQAVTDTASGMRVIRRDALATLYPLSDGLDFTPDMSARALMQRMPMIEIPMPYAERVGESKLRALHDGMRFLRVIGDALLCYRPSRLLLFGFMTCFVPAILLAIGPAELYLRHGYLHEWMIYRFIVCWLLGTIGYSLISTAAVIEELFSSVTHRKWRSFSEQLVHRVFSTKPLLMITGSSTVIALCLVYQGIVELVTTGHVTIHWSRVIVSAFCVIVAAQSMLTVGLLRVIGLWRRSRLLPPTTECSIRGKE